MDEVLATTRAVRFRLDLTRPVEISQVKDCLQVALQAPNGGNFQRWRWLVITDDKRREAIAAVYRKAFRDRYGAFLDDSVGVPVPLRGPHYLATVLHRVPVIVMPCLEIPGGELPEGNQAGLWGSLLPAAWSYMLAARARGLGTTWTSVHLARETEIAAILDLPPTVRQGALIPTAHVTGGRGFRRAPREPLETVVHHDRWQGPPAETTH